jgi:hypothetical protein
MKGPARLRRALSRATTTAFGSISLANTRLRSRRAAAMASTPEPVPTSRMRRGNGVERQQASARGAVMAGAEGERGLDLDADPMRRNAVPIMRAMDDEAAGLDGFEALEALRHPVGCGNAGEGDGLRRLRACYPADQIADRGLVRRIAEMHLHQPAVGRLGGRNRGGIGIGDLVHHVDDALSRRSVDGQAGQRGLRRIDGHFRKAFPALHRPERAKTTSEITRAEFHRAFDSVSTVYRQVQCPRKRIISCTRAGFPRTFPQLSSQAE